MLYPKSLGQNHGPVYREILKHALRTAWHDRSYWILSFFAAFLFTAGVYDYVLNTLTRMARYQSFSWPTATGFFSGFWGDANSVTNIFATLQTVALGAIIILAILGFSCIAQGALVYVLGAKKFKHTPDLRTALYIGTQTFWPVAALSILANGLFLLMGAAFFAVAFWSNSLPAFFYPALVVLGLIETILAFGIGIIQVFAVNAVVLQGAKLADALSRAYRIMKRNWLTTLETAALLLVLALALELIFIWFAFFVSFLLKIVAYSAWSLNSESLYLGAVLAWLVILGAARFAVTAFKTQLQFATWTFLYRRLGEGGVLPKLHRVLRAAFGTYRSKV